MDGQQEPLFFAKPSLRRAFFYAFLYAGAVLYGRFKTDFDESLNPVWWASFGVLLLLLFWALLRRWSTSYTITNQELRCASGILSRNVAVVPLMRVTNANANQSFLERLLGIVNLYIDCAGGDNKEVIFARILKIEATEAARLIRERVNKSTASAT